MIWIMLLTLLVVFFIGFRVLNSRPRRAVRALSERLNLDPLYVESLLSLMGKAPGEAFINYLATENAHHLENAAGVLFIYQVFMVDPSDNSTMFWRRVLRNARLPTEISAEQLRLALTFLCEIEPDAQQLHQQRLAYNARYSAMEPVQAENIRSVLH